jgi:hypothetical protein
MPPLFLAVSLAFSLAALEGTSEPGHAEGALSKSQLTWVAPAGCPTQSAVAAGVEALLGESINSQRAVDVWAEGRVDQIADDRWVLRLSIRSSTGERERVLQGATCQELGEVAVVLVAVAIDPSVGVSDAPETLIEAAASDQLEPNEEEKEEIEEERDETPEHPDEALPPAPADEPNRDPHAALRGSASVATGLLVGPLPGVAPGLRLSLGLRWRLLAVAIGGSHWFERRVRLPPPMATAGGDLQLTTGDVRVCVVPSVRRLELPLCTGAELGALAGRGVGVANPRHGRALWAAWVADAGVTFMPWRWVGFSARAALVVPFTRSTFALDGIGSVHEVAPVGFQGLAGIELRFP